MDKLTSDRVKFPQSPQFSEKYYLRAENSELVGAVLNREFLDMFAAKNWELLFIKDGHLFMGANGSISADNSIQLIEILKAANFLSEVSFN